MRWILNMDAGQAEGLVAAIEAMPSNPSRTEERRRGRFSRADPDRITPRLAVLRNLDGTVDIGIPDDGWSENAILDRNPSLTIVDDRPADKNTGDL